MSVSPETCSEIIRQFDAQGWHRTATPVDQDSGEWLVRQLAALGLDAREVPFPFERVDPDECVITIGEERIPAVPLVDSGLPASGTVVRGTFGAAGTPATLALVRTSAHGMAPEVEAVRDAGHVAIVAGVSGAPGGASLLNAWKFDSPSGPPIVQVAGEAWERLERARASNASIEIRCGASRTKTAANNIRAVVPGSVPGSAPLVVLTPRSGWWHCAGERGGGIAIWLEVARLVRAAGFRRDVVFLATTGHELGFLGAERYLDEQPEFAARAKAWIHLGANIGAAQSSLMVRASDAELFELARTARALATLETPPQFVVAENPVGEAGVVGRLGGRFISFVGAGFPLFHSTLDRWPEAINPAAIAAAGNAVFEMLSALDGNGATPG